jgi:uncharacterized protein (TIGR03000 family)
MSGYYDPQQGNLPTWGTLNGQLNQPATRTGEGVYQNQQPGRTNELNTTPREGATPLTPQSRPTGERPMPQANVQAPATIVVSLPADANLMIEGQPTRATSGERVFVSPPLEPGKTYTYSLKAEQNRNGEKAVASQNVEVRAGETSRVSIDFPNPETRK